MIKANDLAVLQVGIPRSGNLWLYKILKEVFWYAGIEHTSFAESQPIFQQALKWPNFAEEAGIDFIEITADGYFFRKGNYREEITNLEDYVNRCNIVWTHSPYLTKRKDFYGEFSGIVYIIRDPRDVAVSASNYIFTPYMRFLQAPDEATPDTYLSNRLYELTLNWVNHVGGYLLHLNEIGAHVVFFERLLYKFEEEVEQLSNYLNHKLSPVEINQIKEITSFPKMKENSPDHLKSGEWGQWRTVLTEDQKSVVSRISGPLLAQLNYPISENLGEWSLPRIPGEINKEEITRALESSRGNVFEKIKYASVLLRSSRPLSLKLSKGIEFLFQTGRWKNHT